MSKISQVVKKYYFIIIGLSMIPIIYLLTRKVQLKNTNEKNERVAVRLSILLETSDNINIFESIIYWTNQNTIIEYMNKNVNINNLSKVEDRYFDLTKSDLVVDLMDFLDDEHFKMIKAYE